MAIAVAISFDSGVLLCADTTYRVPAGIGAEPAKIFPKQYGPDPCCARSIFVISEPIDRAVAAVRYCERALADLPPAEFTIDRMRATVEDALIEVYQKHLDAHLESEPEVKLLVGLYSPADQQCSLFHTSGTALGEFASYDCQGAAAYLGHYLIRDRYRAAESMDSLDVSTVLSIATETVEGIRECFDGCGDATELIVMYATGRASDVQLLRQDTRKQRKLALSGRLPVAPPL